MKRHEALQPFSRDHHHGLVLARRLSAGATALPAFLQAWDAELKEHLDDEERLLAAVCPPALRERMHGDHQVLRKLAQAARRGALTDEDARHLGARLNDHIRWEERTLFPRIEKTADPQTLETLGSSTQAVELKRGRTVQSTGQWLPR